LKFISSKNKVNQSKKKKTDFSKTKKNIVNNQNTKTNNKNSTDEPLIKKNNVGNVYRGNTKYIDLETKQQRNYVVVADNGKHVSVAKLKSIKIFTEDGKNADKALIEINSSRYGLELRTGVDFQVFNKNRMSGKPLKLDDINVFPEENERFKLGSNDKHNVLVHTKRISNKPKKKKKKW